MQPDTHSLNFHASPAREQLRLVHAAHNELGLFLREYPEPHLRAALLSEDLAAKEHRARFWSLRQTVLTEQSSTSARARE